MKKFTFLAVAALFFANIANASGIINPAADRIRPVHYSNAEPIIFSERGIEFYVFADGQFDFNTQPSQSDVYYKNGRRSANITYGAPGTTAMGRVRIEHDYLGRIRRIGNVFMNYDSNNRIKRIGSVYMSYNRYALTQIGNLRLVYNNRGEIVDFIGNVKGYSYGNSYANNGTSYSQSYNDNDYYYYRADGTKAKVEEKNTKEK